MRVASNQREMASNEHGHQLLLKIVKAKLRLRRGRPRRTLAGDEDQRPRRGGRAGDRSRTCGRHDGAMEAKKVEEKEEL